MIRFPPPFPSLSPCLSQRFSVTKLLKYTSHLQHSSLPTHDMTYTRTQSGRVTLNLEAEGLPKVAQLVTGAVLAFVGILHENGALIVSDMCAPGLPPQRKIALHSSSSDAKESDSDPLMLLVSGLSLGDPTSDPLATDLLVDYVTGNLGGSADHAEAARIAQVIVAGASCYSTPEGAKPAAGVLCVVFAFCACGVCLCVCDEMGV